MSYNVLIALVPEKTGTSDRGIGFDRQRRDRAGVRRLAGIELLVEAGFSAVKAVRIGTLNGATYLGLERRIGSIAPGEDATCWWRGRPGEKVSDI